MVYHRFAYSMPLRSGEESKLFKIRDGAAFSEITAPLTKMGHEYGQIIYNAPFNPKKDTELGREHFKFIAAGDLLVLSTRPPLDDARHGDKRQMLASCSHLEKQVFKECRKHLTICSRSHVQLAKKFGAKCEKADLVFHQNKSARLKYYKGPKDLRNVNVPKKDAINVVFFLRTRSIPQYGCGLLAAFGMGGWETLIWNRIIRTRFPEWVNRPAFIVAELDIGTIPARPVTLEFVDQVKARILLEHVIA
jgi:hypothetical protein